MLSPERPATNIFVPSVLNARLLGIVSSSDTSFASTKVVAADTSLIGTSPMEQIIAKNVRNLILEIFKLLCSQKQLHIILIDWLH